jgi:hypothetical protein
MSEITGPVDRARGDAVAERLGRAALSWHRRLVLSQRIELWILLTMACKATITIPIILQGLCLAFLYWETTPRLNALIELWPKL